MQVRHVPHDEQALPGSSQPDERGYILVMLAFLIIPIMAFIGLSVDVGSWYSQVSDIQKAADSGALAGAVWLPDLAKATTVAKEAAARNGFVDGVDNINVVVSQAGPRRLRVKITNTSASSYFWKIFAPPITLTRQAVAEYVLPVPLGSPTNTLGTGNLLGSPENFWLAASGWCASRENGDLRLAGTDGNYTGGGYSCAGSMSNPDYRSSGYVYAVDLAGAPSGPLNVDIYDASYNVGSTAGDSRLSGTPTVTTTYRLLGADNTPFTWQDNPVLTTLTLTNDAAYRDVWSTLGTINSPGAGTYYVQVFTQANEANSAGSNSFALRGRIGASFTQCSTIVGAPGYSTSCPQVHGVDEMSILANLAGATATFYLANIEPIHAGKKMEINLFDPGEGADSISVLDPNGNPVTFDWRTDCTSPIVPPNGGCSGTTSVLDVSGSGQPQPGPNRGSTSKYSDRMMILTVQLPTNYTTVYGTKQWWKIRYNVGTSPTDRTTWSVNILGDPVHLVND